ncbi:reverse transcriptase domain-containing protein [Tanacetum coccineum]
MPKFAPTIRNLLMNKEKLLELAKIPLNENFSSMLLKKLPKKLGDPGKFLIPCNFPGMDVCHALADLGASINLMPLSIWKKIYLPKLTPTWMTLELADRSITHPKGLVEDVYVKVGKFHFPTDFVVVDFEADPQVPLILGRSFLRTGRSLIDVFEGELILRDENEQIIFHVDAISKHPQKHVNESIKMVNDTCEDSFEEKNNLSSGSTTPLSDFHLSLESFETSKSLLERFTEEPALVCLPLQEDDNDDKENQEVKNIVEPTAKRQTRITPCLKNFIHLSTFRVEEIVPITRESEDTFDNNKGRDLTFCDNNMIFSNPLFGSKDNLTSRDDESFLKEDVQEENFQVYSNPLFEFDDNYNSCFDPGGDNDEIDAFLAIKISTYIEEGYYDSEGDDKSELDTLENMVKVFDPGIWEKTFSPSCVRLSSKDHLYLFFTIVVQILFTHHVNFLFSFENEDTIFDPGIFAFHFSSLELIVFESQMEVCSSTCFIPKDE